MDRNIELVGDFDGDFRSHKLVDSDTGELLAEQRVRKDVDEMELVVEAYKQLDIDPGEIEEAAGMVWNDIKRETGDDTSPFRVDDDEDLE